MSLTYNTLNSIMRELEITMADNVIMHNPIVKYLTQSKVGQPDGVYIEARARYATPSLTMWDGDAELASPNTTETQTKARYTWAHGYVHEKISRTNWQAAAQSGERAIAGLAKETSIAMEDGINLGLEEEWFTEYDGSTHTFNSLVDIVKTTDPTNQASGLGGIALADATWWAANTLAYNSANGDLRYHMQRMLRTCGKIGKPDLIITTEDVINKYEDDIYSKMGILSDTVKAWGFQDLIPFSGVPVYYSPKCTANTMYFLNSNFLELVIHPDDFIKVADWQEKTTTDLNLVSHATLTSQIITSCRRSLGYITGIS